MKFFASFLAFAVLIIPGLSLTTSPQGASDGADRALEVLHRTKTFEGTYSLYIWNRITLAGKEPVEEWSAEFHSGNLHRVETPRDRWIADCRAGTGIAFTIASGVVFEGPEVAAAACGINTNFKFIDMNWLGRVQTELGPAERIRVIDRNDIRQYDVSDDGVLLAATYAENRPGERVLITAKGFKRSSGLPNVDMFDRDSLNVSFVSEEYRTLPKP